MKKAKILLAIFFVTPFLAAAQLDCSGFLSSLKIDPPYKLNSLSKSAVCVSGRTYEFVIPLSVGFEYRFIFYASSVFNSDIKFKIVDLNNNNEVINLPGKSETGAKGTSVLMPYFDQKLYIEIHPYFDFIPTTTTSLKIIIEVDEKVDLIKGCITVVVLERVF